MDLRNFSQIINLLQQIPEHQQSDLKKYNCSLEDLFYYIKGYDSKIGIPETDSLENYPEYQLSRKLLLYVPPILLVIGTIGNLLSFIVLRAHGSKVSTYSYLAALAVMDLFVLYVGLLRLWIAQLTGLDIKDQSDWLCKFVVFFGYVCSDSAVWFIIVVTIERYIAVQYPLKASIMCKVKHKFIY